MLLPVVDPILVKVILHAADMLHTCWCQDVLSSSIRIFITLLHLLISKADDLHHLVPHGPTTFLYLNLHAWSKPHVRISLYKIVGPGRQDSSCCLADSLDLIARPRGWTSAGKFHWPRTAKRVGALQSGEKIDLSSLAWILSTLTISRYEVR
jgi:hypothetical protein